MFIGILFMVVLAGLMPMNTFAAELNNKGLSISPLRQEVIVTPDTIKAGYFTVANQTKKPIQIDFTVHQFSVTDYAYDYKFLTPPKNNWIELREKQTIVQPGKSKKIWYDILVPAKTTPGGYYFSLFASTQIEGEGLPGTIQAASLLYMIVDGKLTRTSVLQNDTIPFIVTGSEIPYKFDVENTGNVHFSAYFYGEVHGLFFGKGEQVGTGQVLMPDAVKEVKGTIPSPVLPGIYKVEYGYKVDFASIITAKTAYIVFIPPWSVVALIFIVLFSRWLWQKKRPQKRSANQV